MKKILITGASEGIGLEIAKLLAQAGNQLQLVARNKEKLEKVVESLSGTGHQFIAADLSRKEDVHVITDEISRSHYDVLINNAGVGIYGRFEEIPFDRQVNMMNLNMVGLTKLSHVYLATAKKGDSLVNVASTLGATSFPGSAVYSATKAYILNLSESLWWENKRRGVYVMGFCPGVTQTNFHGGGDAAKLYPRFIIQTPAAVARELAQALAKRRKPRIVSGAVNRFTLFFYRWVSRKMEVNMMGSFSPLAKS